MSEVESLSLGGLGIIICIFVHVLPFLCACCSWTTVNDLQQQLSQHMFGKTASLLYRTESITLDCPQSSMPVEFCPHMGQSTASQGFLQQA